MLAPVAQTLQYKHMHVYCLTLENLCTELQIYKEHWVCQHTQCVTYGNYTLHVGDIQCLYYTWD